MVNPLLSLIEVEKEFKIRGSRGKTNFKAVNNVSLDIYEGETVGLVGESGSGKSTLGFLIMNLVELSKGKILFEGQDLQKLGAREQRILRTKIQVVFQDPQSSLDPRFKIGQIVEEPLRLNGWRNKLTRKERVNELLQKVGLDEQYAKRLPHQLSGGQRQRVAIARALAISPKLIVLDEPTSALDVSVQAQILNLLATIQQETGLAYLFISHNLAVIRHLSQRVAVMYQGRIVEMAAADALFEQPYHPYTRLLLQSLPDINSEMSSAPDLHKEVSNFIVQKGCSFYSRCPIGENICSESVPELLPLDSDHRVACHLR